MNVLESVRRAFSWRVKVHYDEILKRYVATYKSKIIFIGTKEETERFLDLHTISSLVKNEAF